jgi:thiamine kinase-like enzyme
LIESFPSFVIYPTVVSKLFADEAIFARELQVYSFALPHVPELLSSGKAHFFEQDLWYITTKRIKGKAYLDAANFSAGDLAKAIAEFHQAGSKGDRCLCHYDNQPQNILMSGSDYYFIDFSDSKIDYPEADISHLLLFWAEEFGYMDFIGLAISFIDSYQTIIPLDAKRWQRYLRKSILRFDHRRVTHHKTATHSQDSVKNRDWLAEVI